MAELFLKSQVIAYLLLKNIELHKILAVLF